MAKTYHQRRGKLVTAVRSETEDLSEYELVREANIRANTAMLVELGLVPNELPTLSIKRLKRNKEHGILVTDTAVLRSNERRERRSYHPTDSPLRVYPQRIKCRRSTLYEKICINTSVVSDLRFESTALTKSAECTHKEFEKNTASEIGWDQKRHHQHLTVSTTGHSVATTGCAGYGAALAEQGTALHGRKLNLRYWEIEAVAFGVGGFAVGLARSSWSGPYKSLGNADAVNVIGVYHSNGSFISNRKVSDYGPAYSEGDIIGVRLHENGNLVFFLNGKDLGPTIQTSVKAQQKKSDVFVLACQPYMGGIACIIRATE